MQVIKKYKCDRCEYTTGRRNNFVRHTQRKLDCTVPAKVYFKQRDRKDYKRQILSKVYSKPVKEYGIEALHQVKWRGGRDTKNNYILHNKPREGDVRNHIQGSKPYLMTKQEGDEIVRLNRHRVNLSQKIVKGSYDDTWVAKRSILRHHAEKEWEKYNTIVHLMVPTKDEEYFDAWCVCHEWTVLCECTCNGRNCGCVKKNAEHNHVIIATNSYTIHEEQYVSNLGRKDSWFRCWETNSSRNLQFVRYFYLIATKTSVICWLKQISGDRYYERYIWFWNYIYTVNHADLTYQKSEEVFTRDVIVKYNKGKIGTVKRVGRWPIVNEHCKCEVYKHYNFNPLNVATCQPTSYMYYY